MLADRFRFNGLLSVHTQISATYLTNHPTMQRLEINSTPTDTLPNYRIKACGQQQFCTVNVKDNWAAAYDVEFRFHVARGSGATDCSVVIGRGL